MQHETKLAENQMIFGSNVVASVVQKSFSKSYFVSLKFNY